MTEHAHSPLAQFEIKPLVSLPHFAGFDVSFTNASLFMVLAVAGIALFILPGMRARALVPGRWQSMVEASYQLVAEMIRENVGADGKKYFPIIFSLFMFILFCNLLGMVPFGFTVTSHIIVTFALAAFVFVGVTLVGLLRHGPKFFSLFLPHGTPWWIAPLMIPIEIIAYLARPISLSMRLAANMMVGHTLMKVIAGFVIMLGLFGGWLPLAFMAAFTGFEIGVAMLQAYIFTILTCIYLHDAIHLH